MPVSTVRALHRHAAYSGTRHSHAYAARGISVIVGRFDTVVGDEGPERFAVRKDVRTRARQSRDVGRRRALEHRLEPQSQRTHPDRELVAGELPILEAVPVLEDERGAVEQLAAERAGGSIALGERHELADEMSLIQSAA